MIVRIEPLSSFIKPPGSWFYRGDNYFDAGGRKTNGVQSIRYQKSIAKGLKNSQKPTLLNINMGVLNIGNGTEI